MTDLYHQLRGQKPLVHPNREQAEAIRQPITNRRQRRAKRARERSKKTQEKRQLS